MSDSGSLSVPIDWSTWYKDVPGDEKEGTSRKLHCLHCTYETRYPSDIRRHVKLTHIGERKFECTECKLTFKQSDKLRRHMLTIHAQVKTHVCEVCQKSFRDTSKLREHLHSHINDRPHHCLIPGCTHSFNAKSALSKHVREFHLNIRNFECFLCHQRFFLSKHLQRHQSKPCGQQQREESNKDQKADPSDEAEKAEEAHLAYAPSMAPILNPEVGVMPQYMFPQSYGKFVRTTRKNRVWLLSETASIGTEISEEDYQAESFRAALRSMDARKGLRK